MLRSLVVTGLLALSCYGAAAIECPVGSYPWVDNWGNQICRRFGDGSTATIQPSTPGCPTGSVMA